MSVLSHTFACLNQLWIQKLSHRRLFFVLYSDKQLQQSSPWLIPTALQTLPARIMEWFLATEVFLVSLRSDDSSRFWLSSFQHLSNFLMLCSYQKSFSSFPHFFLIWAHTKRVIQRCFPMHLAPSGIPGWLTTQVSGLPNPFSWFSPLLFFVGSTNSKRKFFLNDVQFCFYSMM